VGPDAVQVNGRTIATTISQAVGSAVTLLVRPEDLSLVGEVDGLAGTVTATTFQGATTVVTVRLDVLDSLVAVSTPGSADANRAPGDRVGVHIDGSRALCESVG
jgi:ABC-type Fe3+/spermidine/putrescine transport system ATPase subunit